MLLDTILLCISGGFASALVLSEPQLPSRLAAILLFAIHVGLFWLVVLPYHRERAGEETTDYLLDNIDIL